MLEQVACPIDLNTKEQKKKLDELAERLALLQQQAKMAGLPIVVLFEGWGSAGKGSRISDLVVALDPRLFKVFTTEDPVGYENRLPFMSRFWSKLEPHGTMTIFNQAYYDALARAIIDRMPEKSQVEIGLSVPQSPVDDAVSTFMNYIQSIESQMAEDGYLIVKFFLHITKEEQRKRFVNLMLDADTSWRVTADDIRQFQRYEDYYRVYSRLLESSNVAHAPWTLINAQDKHCANLEIMQTLVDSIGRALESRAEHVKRLHVISAAEKMRIERAQKDVVKAQEDGNIRKLAEAKRQLTTAQIGDASMLTSSHVLKPVPSLDDVRHDLVLKNDEYHTKLEAAQIKLNELQKIIFKRRIPMIIVYEGWDAAGKGGNIKRVASALDARSYVVHPISAPTPEELAHPFLWRFWTKLPRTGHIAIFDRSWYGRVMVERVERLATNAEWTRAFDEINDFEAQLNDWGAILIKFWINVSQDEQLRRFEDRRDDPARSWKLTNEDWRNREKSDLYHQCVNDMLRLTSTEFAPWHIIESDNKKYARVKALNIINETIEQHLAKLI